MESTIFIKTGLFTEIENLKISSLMGKTGKSLISVFPRQMKIKELTTTPIIYKVL